ncbi:MAG: hypothetical protein CMK04_01130 [Ponticaulis sp.]|nr:hypothetical protein [Ponticaulis sp.]
MASGATHSSKSGVKKSAAIRLIRLSVPESAASSADIKKTIGTYSKRFLENTVKIPFKYQVLDFTAFMISADGHEDELDEYVISLQMRLREFLFGSEEDDTGEIEVLSFAGSMDEIQTFLKAPTEEARRISDAFRNKVEELNRTTETPSSTWRYNWHSGTSSNDHRFRFRGILQCKQRIVIAHAITAMDMYGAPGFDDIHLGKFLKARDQNTIDFEITAFRHAVERAKVARASGTPLVLFTPVTYRTLIAKEARTKFLDAVREAPEWIDEHVGIMVFCGPNSPSFDAIQRCATDFGAHFRYMDWQISSTDMNASRFMNSGLHTVTFDIHAIINDRLTEIENFGAHIPELRKLKIRAAITGVKTRDELLSALKTGVSFVSGPFVTTALREPLHPRQISPADLPLSDQTLEAA